MKKLNCKPEKLKRGFTMIELLVVVAMIGVMVAIVGPKFRINESTEVQLAGMQLVQDMELARTRALATRSDVRFVFENQTTTGSWAGYLDHDANGVIGETEEERFALRGFGKRELPARIEYGKGNADPIPIDKGSSDISFADGKLEFNSRGLTEPMGTSGVVYLTHVNDPDQATAISVSGSGSMRLWSWRDGSWQ